MVLVLQCTGVRCLAIDVALVRQLNAIKSKIASELCV